MYIGQCRQRAPKELLDDLINGGKYSRYKRPENGRAISKRDYSICPVLNSVYILADGTVVHCCYDYRTAYTFGSAFEEGLKKVWKKTEYVRWRKEYAKPMRLPLCKSCTVGILEQWYYVYQAQGA